MMMPILIMIVMMTTMTKSLRRFGCVSFLHPSVSQERDWCTVQQMQLAKMSDQQAHQTQDNNRDDLILFDFVILIIFNL